MPRFRQDNTEGYTDADLAEMNAAFEQIMAGDYPDRDEADDFNNIKSVEDHLAESIQSAFDRGARGVILLLS